jgi:DNA-directed RNA polymerase specialized sigma24 family protein
LEEVRDALRTPPGFTDERVTALVALDASLERLEAANPRQSRIVECRFFGGMTIKDTAEALGVSPATVKRGWSLALAWLYRDLKRSAVFEGRSSARSDTTDAEGEG